MVLDALHHHPKTTSFETVGHWSPPTTSHCFHRCGQARNTPSRKRYRGTKRIFRTEVSALLLSLLLRYRDDIRDFIERVVRKGEGKQILEKGNGRFRRRQDLERRTLNLRGFDRITMLFSHSQAMFLPFWHVHCIVTFESISFTGNTRAGNVPETLSSTLSLFDQQSYINHGFDGFQFRSSSNDSSPIVVY